MIVTLFEYSKYLRYTMYKEKKGGNICLPLNLLNSA